MPTKVEVQVTAIKTDAVVPTYRHPGDSGFDLHCAEDVVIPANGVAIIPTGLCFAVPEGYEIQIRMRSGASMRTPLIIPNSPGTIDSGYRGEVGIIARNLSAEDWQVSKGERIAQGVLAPVACAIMHKVEILADSQRGKDGFGSTGQD